jgi:hypothetical protein
MAVVFAILTMSPGTASAVTLQELVDGQSITWNDKQFDNFSVEINGNGRFIANANTIAVSGLTLGDEHGLRFTGLIAALATGEGSSNVTIMIGFDVTVVNPALGIDGLSLSFNGALTGNGATQVIENVSDGMGLSEQVTVSAPDVLSEHLDLPGSPFTTLHITKTIQVDSGDPGVTTISVINQTFSQTSKPTTLSLDIKPGSCPNPLNRNSNGVLPVALLGTDTFDVTLVDLASIQLYRADGVAGSVTPLEGPPGPRSVVEDVGTIFEGDLCDCHDLRGDGFDDLSMKFNKSKVVEILELDDLEAGSYVELVLSGFLLDGTPFSASDCILLVPREKVTPSEKGPKNNRNK